LRAQYRQVIEIPAHHMCLVLHTGWKIALVEDLPVGDYRKSEFDGSLVQENDIYTVCTHRMSQHMEKPAPEFRPVRFPVMEHRKIVVAQGPQIPLKSGTEKIDQFRFGQFSGDFGEDGSQSFSIHHVLLGHRPAPAIDMRTLSSARHHTIIDHRPKRLYSMCSLTPEPEPLIFSPNYWRLH
jgi:hypothetical protein